ncbi:MAG TPA: hypothetical protein VKV80_04535, partial [Streptosporangiaceae bacterium]|nr:hypothetical protein [Streptosporangiaceae bacterium]
MRIVELSDHPGVLLRKEQERQRGAEQEAESRYAAELARYRDRVRAARARREEARRERRWLAWLRAVFAARRERARAPRPPAVPGWR